jgi:uncharacterized protein (TIGR02266 family)
MNTASASTARVRPPPFPGAARQSPRAAPEERGGLRRVTATIAVTYTSGANFFSGRTRNISEGGLFLESRAKLDVGDPVCVNLHLMKQTFAIRCQVTWVLGEEHGAPIGVGLRFVNLDPRAKRAIEAFMMLRDPIAFIVT